MTSDPTAELREQFCRIYDQKLWGLGSGVGSSPENTVEYRSFLRQFMRCNHIRSVVDLGCGDWQFSRYVDWSGVTYVGVDVVPSVIESNQREFANGHITFRKFESLAKLPAADLLVCKDVLQHLPNEAVTAYLSAFRKTYKFSLITNDEEPEHLQNIDIQVGGWRPLRLEQAPFCEPGAVVLSWIIQWGAETTRTSTYLLHGNSVASIVPEAASLR
jgi:SAM-dependent methyltransferase